MTLYIKHRPKTFDEFVGNEEVINSIKSIVSKPLDIPHVFLFEGDYGSGKTTLAYILANNLNCGGPNLLYLDAGTFRKVESADDIKKDLLYLPFNNQNKIYIIDEIQTTTGSKFQESLLNTLENLPNYAYFIFCTTNLLKINKGILSRALIFSLRNYTIRELIKILKNIINKERKNIDDSIIRYIASVSMNSPREAITNLEKIINYENIDLEKTKKIIKKIEYNEDNNTIQELTKALLQNKNLNIIKSILLKSKLTPTEIRLGIINYCYNIIFKFDDIDYAVILLFQVFTTPSRKFFDNNLDKYLLLSIILDFKEKLNE